MCVNRVQNHIYINNLVRLNRITDFMTDSAHVARTRPNKNKHTTMQNTEVETCKEPLLTLSVPTNLRQSNLASLLSFLPSFLYSFCFSLFSTSTTKHHHLPPPLQLREKNPLLHKERPTRKHSSTPRSFCIVTTVNTNYSDLAPTVGHRVCTRDRFGSWQPARP